MPYYHARPLKKIENRDPLWRYLDLPKFLSLLETSSLHFSTLESLGNEDSFEGQLTTPRKTLQDINYDNLTKIQKRLYEINSKDDFKNVLMLNSMYIEWNIAARKVTYVNCWHQNKTHSMAMWKLYCGTSGVAIQTSLTRIIKSLKKAEQPIAIGQVDYIDYKKDDIKLIGWPWIPAFYKRNNFIHESEIRLMYYDWPRFKNWLYKTIKGSPFNLKNTISMRVPVDLNMLIEKVYLPPTTHMWVQKIVRSILKKYNLNKPVISTY